MTKSTEQSLKPESYVTNDKVEYRYNYQTHTASKLYGRGVYHEFHGADIRFLIEAFNEVEVLRAGQQLVIAALHEENERLVVALNDLLNDCINFDGGKLSEWALVKASDALKAVKEK